MLELQLKKFQINIKKWGWKIHPPSPTPHTHTFLVDEAELETIKHNDESNEDIFANESILAAENKVFDFNKNKKEQAAAIDKLK